MPRFLGLLRFLSLSSDPGSATTGDTYYNSSTGKLRVHTGSGFTDVGGGGGALALSIIEKDLGGRRCGSFDVTGLSGLTPNRPVLVQQASGPYTGKGTLADEAEMDLVLATGHVVDASTIRVYWIAQGAPMMGNVKFQYAVG